MSVTTLNKDDFCIGFNVAVAEIDQRGRKENKK